MASFHFAVVSGSASCEHARTVVVAQVSLAWYGRALFAVGFALTMTTGVSLWVWSEQAGENFAWEIKAPLTAAYMGSWYLGASFGLLLGLRERAWSRARTILIVAFALTTMSLISTVRFFDAFRFGDGSTSEQLIAWIWLAVYACLPPLLLLVFVLNERAGGWTEYRVEAPFLPFTVGMLLTMCATATALGLWLTLSPSTLVDVWPWTLNDLSASIVGAWLVTLGAGTAWMLRERDWRRARIALWPAVLALALLLIAAIRFDESLTGSAASIAVYVGAVAGTLVMLVVVGAAQAHVERVRIRPPAS